MNVRPRSARIPDPVAAFIINVADGETAVL